MKLLKIKDVCPPDRKTFFAGVMILGALICGIFCYCSPWITVFALVAGLITFMRVEYADFPIEDKRLKLGCACMEFCILTASCFFCASGKDGVKIYCWGVMLACGLSALFYLSMPKIFSLLKLINIDGKIHKCNTGLSMCLFYGVVLCVEAWVEASQIEDVKFAREQFIPITKWHTEVQQGSTCYMLYCSKGVIQVSPSEYPEIRNINAHTKIKALTWHGSDGKLLYVKRLEIKN